jgi:hypothetical protein
MYMKKFKAIIAGLVLSISGFVNAGVMTYNGPTGTSVDTNPSSLFEIVITDDYLIQDLNVQIELSDSGTLFWTDLDLSLSNGFTTVIMALSQNNDSSGIFDVIFDDEALTSLPTTSNAVGSFQSFQNLSAFDGQSTAGTWTLSILDDYIPDENNELVSYSIITAVPEPSSLAIFALGVMGLAARRFKK